MEVSLAKLNKNFTSDNDEVNITFEDMKAKGLIPKSKSKVRITSVGRINKKFNVEAHQISRQAYTTIKKNGGSVKYLESTNHILKVNFKKLQKWFPAGGKVNPEDLKKLGVLKDNQIVSLVNKGRVNCKFEIQVHKASKSARRKIEAKGGEVNIIE
ncbi:MAG: uL15 family ribosomal protein [Deltaproteobacteria bacterium]|nr:uL15 family ribosomal protein [Deltaproteobacteria bacterium]